MSHPSHLSPMRCSPFVRLRKPRSRCVQAAAMALCGASMLMSLNATVHAQGPVFINEIFFNPGGDGSDVRDEYIEIRGDSNAPLTDHYLLIIESENNGETGFIENIFDLGAYSLGSNGFLALRQKFSRYGNPSPINPAATDLVNAGPNLPGPAFPGFGDGDASTIGASDLPSLGSGPGDGQLEGSGFTAFLIHNESGDAPELGQDLDVDDNGLDVETGAPGWSLLDSIGFITEFDELDGRLYAQTNFIRTDEFVTEEDVLGIIEPGSQYATVSYEMEYLGRWGNSTGSSPDDWHASNFTDNLGSGSSGVQNDSIDWRQSLVGDHPVDDGDPLTPAPPAAAVESNKDVPYGTRLAASIGGPNYITGDANGDGYVNLADYTVWRDTMGTIGSELAHPAADYNHDFRVDALDYAIWKDNFGAPFNTVSSMLASASRTAVPEPASLALLMTALLSMAVRRR